MSTLLLMKEDATTSSNTQEKICKICNINPWKYTCPRCNVNYCTVPCYQSEAHGSCSEAFYKDCIMEEMGAEVGNPESERKMMEILIRSQQEPTTEEIESDDEPDLADRIASVDLNDADAVWERLTDTERQEFERLVQSGDASELLPPWTPWWEFKVEKRLVIDVDEKPVEEMSYAKNCPKLKKNVKPLSQITSVPPSRVVRNAAVNVAAAYCATARWLNGRLGAEAEPTAAAPEAAHALLALSGALAEGRNYATADLAQTDVAQRALDCPWLGFSADSAREMRRDVRAVCAGPEPKRRGFYLAALLSDARAVVQAAKASAKKGASAKSSAKAETTEAPIQMSSSSTSEPVNAKNGPFSRRFGPDVGLAAPPTMALSAAARKLDYLLSWAASGGEGELCGEGVLEALEGRETLGIE